MNLEKQALPFSARTASDTGVLVLHGFTGTPATVMPLGRSLDRAGYNVEVPCLAGHGRRWADLNRLRYQDWLADAEKALARLRARCSRVLAAGLSMGGALTLVLAQGHPDLAGIVLINPAVFLVPRWKTALLPLFRRLWPSIESGPMDVKDPEVPRASYDRTPLEGLYQMTRLLKEARGKLARVRQPALIFQSREDHVLPPRGAVYIFERIGSAQKELVWLDNSYHVATMDYDRELISDKTLAFIREIAGKEGP
ncbi:MAG: alpha/beta fold hydrolase [Thermodesulfobacteriota bacterium]